MNPRRYLPWIALVGLFVSGVVRAGGEESPESLAASKAARVWERQGVRAIPPMIRALCEPDPFLGTNAAALLAGLGMPAAKALLAAGTEAPCAGELPPTVVLGRLLCRQATAAQRSALVGFLREALLGEDEPRAFAAADAISSGGRIPEELHSSYGCDAPSMAALQAALVEPLRGALALGTPLRRQRVLAAVAAIGPQAAPLVPELVQLVAKGEGGTLAFEALRRIGPAAAPALPALADALRGADLERAAAIAAALGRIGSASRGLALELRGLFGRTLVDAVLSPPACERAPLLAVATVAEALGGVGGAELAPVAPDLAALALVYRGCPTLAKVALDALRRLGPHGAGASPVLAALVGDATAPIALRREAGGVLLGSGAPLAPADRALATALARKDELTRRLRPSAVPQKPPPDAAVARDNLQLQLDVCNAEVDRPSQPVPDDEVVDEALFLTHHRFAGCLRESLCGPTAGDRTRTLARCCAAEYGAAVPPWCR